MESIVKIEELKGAELVKDYSDEIERMLGSKMKSVKVRRKRRKGRSRRETFGWGRSRQREEVTLSSSCQPPPAAIS